MRCCAGRDKQGDALRVGWILTRDGMELVLRKDSEAAQRGAVRIPVATERALWERGFGGMAGKVGCIQARVSD